MLLLFTIAAADTSTGADRPAANRLAGENSPYLLAHAHDPVDWHPWGEEAFARARAEDKAVFLSVGYSTCHWCHVMQRESFQNPEIAAQMNAAFVCVKVDREERPDVDHLYMAACQVMSGAGGWPLTVVMTPEGRPFFAGTYFPPQARYGRPGMDELVPRLAGLWAERRDEAAAASDEVVGLLSRMSGGAGGGELTEDLLRTAFAELAADFDERNGGFGRAPKFPMPVNLLFLLRYGRRAGNAPAREMAGKALRAMRRGGVYDQLGFGFHRYSTDAEWRVPHFEKMLYDQALLAMAYAEAYQAAGDPFYEETAREVFEYVGRDLTSPDGTFYAAEDADSEGEEGRYYLWTVDEIRAALPPEEAAAVISAYGVKVEGNFADEAGDGPPGRNVLYLEGPETADLAAAREKLLAVRGERLRPHRDEKILADWNGLMIAAYAKAARAFGEATYAGSARRAADFVLRRMRDREGRLYHSRRESGDGVPAFLDDYAFLTWGLIELYEATFEVSYLASALDLAVDTWGLFWDHEAGAFHFTPAREGGLIVRKKEFYDGAVPSGNAVATVNLLRLARLTGDAVWEERAAAATRAMAGPAARSPAGTPFFLAAADWALGSSLEVVVAGDAAAPDTREMLRALGRVYLPHAVVLFKAAGDDELGSYAEYTKTLKAINGRATAYVCRDFACRTPTNDVNELINSLKGE
ncbi:MAG: thioredoxin domain-containing protein [Candidatus Zixiibacteriota bacterium]|jgi:hypothetical protein